MKKKYSEELPEELDHQLPYTHTSAFEQHPMPVVVNSGIFLFHWGLIPHWAKDNTTNYTTANAKVEGIDKKPTWKTPIQSQRCLVPATGFFEWRHEGKDKYPYYIYQKDTSIFSFAGIYDQWINPNTKDVFHSFSIITTAANKLMQKIHNTKKRMPIILHPSDENDWINPNSSWNTVEDILKNTNVELQAKTLRKDFLKLPDKKKLTPWEYPELNLIDLF